MGKLISCETVVGITTHVRECEGVPRSLGSHSTPEGMALTTLCGQKVGWDLPVDESPRCRKCRKLAKVHE